MKLHVLVAILLFPPLASLENQAWAIEVGLSGYYRARWRVFDSLSLTHDLATSEGTRDYIQHRLRLNPQLKVNENVSFFLQMDIFDLLTWGSDPEISGAQYGFPESSTFSSSLVPGEDYTENFAIKRGWAEVVSDVGKLKVGRMPFHWGMGLFFNDGNGWDADFGDTVDRLLFLTRLGPIYAVLAYDTNSENLVDEPDDVQTGNLMVLYRGEFNSLGLYTGYRTDASNDFSGFTFDLYGKARVGPVTFEAESLYLMADGLVEEEGGSLTSSFDQYGGIFKGTFSKRHFDAGLEFGFASGDSDPDDTHYTALSFDRDYDVALIMFEEIMPAFAGGDTSSAVSYDAVSNAYYLLPRVAYRLTDRVQGSLSFLAAWAMKTSDATNNKNDYGMEADLDLKVLLFSAFEVGLRQALFFPGAVYEEREMVYGSELRCIVNF